MVLQGMQPAERITSGKAWGQVGWPVSPQLPTYLPHTHYQPLGSHILQQRRSSSTSGRSVAAEEALVAPGGLPPILANLL